MIAKTARSGLIGGDVRQQLHLGLYHTRNLGKRWVWRRAHGPKALAGASNFRVNTNLAQEIILATAGLLSGQAITVISDIRDKVIQPLSGREAHRKVVEMGNLQHPSRERGDSARVCETGPNALCTHACERQRS